jgi:KDO2-lipid IV(A) lauroyltransferase
VAEQNLRLAFPKAKDEEIAHLLVEQWDNTGRTFVETLIMDRIIADPSRVEVVNGERLDEIARSGKPVVFVSGHLSNWEVMPAVIAHSDVPCQITYRAANNPYVDKRIKDSRFRYGVRLFAPKGGDGAREILEAMAHGQSVALMNDQKYNGGVAAPFFGHMAHTASGPTKFALRFGTVLQPMSVQRQHKARFRVLVHDPIVVKPTGDRNADLETGVRKINAFIEARVRERPAEWFWVHRRWPREHYKKRRRA